MPIYDVNAYYIPIDYTYDIKNETVLKDITRGLDHNLGINLNVNLMEFDLLGYSTMHCDDMNELEVTVAYMKTLEEENQQEIWIPYIKEKLSARVFIAEPILYN